MGKNRAVINFEEQFLTDLVNDESSCVKVEQMNYHLALHPFHLNNIKESVKDILNQGISRYDKKLDGILLGYQDIKLLSNTGTINNDSFFIHMDVAAAFYLFKPEVGKILTGTVNKKSEDHVGCLVHKTFNVSLPRPTENSDDNWKGSRVGIGQDILFRITFTDLEARLPYMRAELVSILSEPDSGISTSEEYSVKKPKKIKFDSNSENEELEIAQVKKKKKKKRKDSESEIQQHEDSTHKHSKKRKHEDVSLEYSQPEVKKNKKSKHKRSLSQSLEVDIQEPTSTKIDKNRMTEGSEINEEPLKKKKRKHKHSHVENDLVLENIHKKHDIDQLDANTSKSKKHKKSKHKDSLQHLQDAALQKILSNFGESSSSVKNKTKKKRKKHNESDDISLPDLHLSGLFNEESISIHSKSTFLMADHEDKTTKGGFASTSHVSLQDDKIELPSDSDLENILNLGDKHKRKSKDKAEKIRKRKRSTSSDDFVTPKIKKRRS